MRYYDEFDQARWVPEPPGNPERGAFERDRARVLHSAALRRLAGKTQVVTAGESDFPRTRLTHSLECAQIGRELGGVLGCDPDLVETACLAHDLGHPPFGHNGETALDEVAAACGGFEGNAQSLRLLTRLEAKIVAPDGGSAGLNLTRAALNACMKYPWTRQNPDQNTGKYGVYTDDGEVFTWVRRGLPDDRVSLEAQIMDWSDDVAYSVHDLEDALYSGYVSPVMLGDAGERREVCKRTMEWYVPDAGPAELEHAFAGLLAEPYWPAGYDGTMPALAALKNLTSELIGRLCRPITATAGELVVPRETRLECALLKGVTAHYVMARDDHNAAQARQRELILELAARLRIGAPHALDPALRPAFEAAVDDGVRLRVIVDQIASLTDTSAVAWHRRLCR